MTFLSGRNIIRDKDMHKPKYNLLVSIALNIAICALAILFYGAHYETDDEFAMSSLASGMWGVSTSKLIFSNVILGTVLQALYSICSSINWIIWLYYAGMVMAGTAILYFASERKNTCLTVLCACFIVLFYKEAFIVVNFTRVSAYIACGGYYCIFDYISRGKKFAWYVGGGLLILSSLIRFDSFMLISAFMFVVWGGVAISKRQHISPIDFLRKLVSPFAVILGLIFILWGIDFAIYDADPEWRQYREYNEVRSEILDHGIPAFSDRQEEYESIGVSYEAYNSLINWSFADPNVFSLETLQKIAGMREKKKINFSFLENSYEFVKDCMQKYYLYIPVFACIFGVFIKKKWNLAILIVPLLLELGYYNFVSRTVERVIVGTAMGFSMALIITCAEKLHGNQEKWHQKRAIVPLLLSGFSYLVLLYPTNIFEYVGFSGFSDENIVQEYDSIKDGSVYIFDTFSFDRVFWDTGTFSAPKRDLLTSCYAIGGWTTGMPLHRERMQQDGISNLYLSLIEREDVYLIGSRNLEIQKAYLRSQYDKSVVYSKVGELRGEGIYKFTGIVDDAEKSDIESHIVKIESDADWMYITVTVSADPDFAYIKLQDGASGTSYMYRAAIDGESFLCTIPIEEYDSLSIQGIEVMCESGGVYYYCEN